MMVEPELDQPVEYAVLDACHVLVELVLQVVEVHNLAETALEQPAHERPLMGRQLRPLIGILEQFKGIGVPLKPAGHALLLSLRNLQIAPDGEVYDGRRDVAHIGAVVDQRADFGRCHPFGWLVLGANSQTRRIPSTSVPEAIHENQGEDGYEEDPIGA